MPYLLLIIEPTGQRLARGRDAGAQVYERMLRYTDDLASRGVLIASNSLTSAANGTRVQVRDGKQRLIDGPFAEAKEMVGGFFLLNSGTREEALAIASACPAAEWCTVEVREVGPCYD